MQVGVSGPEALEGFYDALLDDDAEQLYDRAPCGYLSTTPDGTIIKANQTFLTLTGYQRQDLIGRRSFVELLTAGGRIYHETHYAPMLRMQGTAREIALDLVRADGSRLPVLVNAVLERDAGGQPVVIRTAVFDATDRREYERELLRAKQRAEESEARATALARTLQRTLIPPSPPAIPGLDIAAEYRPAGNGEEVGGDFYDVFQIADDDWVVALGDVCGKGVEAAVVTATVRYTIRAAAVMATSTPEILHRVNTVLLRQPSDRFCTVALIRLHRVDCSWEAQVASAGHPLPLLIPAGGEPQPVGSPGSLLGVLPEPRFTEAAIPLDAHHTLLTYTDGVTEARRDGEFYGEDRLRAMARNRAPSAAAVARGLLDDVLAFQAGFARDDIAIVAVRAPG
jgi:sigma-B regulation protein RsbU (phosphoserine phosphatase)